MSPVYLSQVVCSVLPPCAGGEFMLSFLIMMRCLKVRLEVRPGFSGACPVVPFAAVVIQKARVVYKSVHIINDK